MTISRDAGRRVRGKKAKKELKLGAKGEDRQATDKDLQPPMTLPISTTLAPWLRDSAASCTACYKSQSQRDGDDCIGARPSFWRRQYFVLHHFFELESVLEACMRLAITSIGNRLCLGCMDFSWSRPSNGRELVTAMTQAESIPFSCSPLNFQVESLDPAGGKTKGQ
jgi:hypothetical protein